MSKKNRPMDNKNKKNVKEQKAEEKLEEVVAETISEVPETEQKAEDEKEIDLKDAKLAELEAKLEALNAENADLKDRMIRMQADTENYKKRVLRDKEDAVKFANSALIKDILGPMDDFKRAIEASEKTKDYDAMHDGIKMIDDRLFAILKTNWGLEEIGKEGEAFDANLHEACMLSVDENVDKETVEAVFQKGYMLHGRVLRAAKVKVVKPNN